jgi:hypothetical protein
MNNDSYLFKQVPTHNCVPLIQGNMFHQFNNNLAAPKYWIDLDEGRKKLLGKQEDKDQKLSYQDYRLVHRRIARNTDQRSLIACILPKNRFCADTAQTVKNILPYKVTIYIATLFNSFVNDYQIRQRITAHCDIHFMCSLKIPRLKEGDRYFEEIVENAAKLICVSEEFDELAKEVGIYSHKNGVTEETERAKIRAKLDAIVGHLYELNEIEFQHILSTFPLASESVKTATLKAYQNL